MLSRLTPPENGVTYISVGMNQSVFNRIDQQHAINGRDIKPYIDSLVRAFDIKKSNWAKAAGNAPTLYKYLLDNIHK
jgi:hypothetical protein